MYRILAMSHKPQNIATCKEEAKYPSLWDGLRTPPPVAGVKLPQYPPKPTTTEPPRVPPPPPPKKGDK